MKRCSASRCYQIDDAIYGTVSLIKVAVPAEYHIDPVVLEQRAKRIPQSQVAVMSSSTVRVLVHEDEEISLIISSPKIPDEPLVLWTRGSIRYLGIQADEMRVPVVEGVIGLGAIWIVMREVEIIIVQRAFFLVVAYCIV